MTKINPKPKTDAEVEEERKQVKIRISNTIKGNMPSIITWLKKTMSPKFRDSVLELVWGNNWEEITDMDQYQWYAFCSVRNLDKSTLLEGLTTFDKKFSAYNDEERTAIFKTFGLCYGQSLAKSHNKVMHALNGNVLIKTHDELKTMPLYRSVIAKNDATMPLLTGNEMQCLINNITGDLNTNLSAPYYQDRLRANGVTAENTVLHNIAISLPNTNLQSVTVAPDGEDWEPINGLNLRVSKMNTATYMVNSVARSKMALAISENITLQNFSTWRKNNISLAGFSSRDIVNMANTINVKGLSTEQICMKIELLHSIMALRADPSAINSSLFQMTDTEITPTLETPATVSFNDVADPEDLLNGINCGGHIDPVFPFSGVSGVLAFHQSIDTVPTEGNRRSNVIFMNTGLMDAGRDSQENIALHTMMWAEWPFCMYVVNKEVQLENPELEPTKQPFVPNQTLTSVPGRFILDIILPRKVSDSDPTTGQMANAMATVVPEWGPTYIGPEDNTGPQPRTPIQINFLGGETVEVNLCHYLCSWAEQFDVTTIIQYLNRVNTIIDISKTMRVVHDLNVALCMNYPPLMLAEGGQKSPGSGSEAATNRSYSSGFEVSRHIGRWGEYSNVSCDMRLYETDSQMWNMATLGLLQGIDIVVGAFNSLPVYLGHPKANYWERLESICMAAVWQVFYHMSGLTSEAWQQAYTNVQSQFLQMKARALFSNETTNGYLKSSRMGPVLTACYKNMYDRSPAVTQTIFGEGTMDISHFGRWLAYNDFAGVYSDDETLSRFLPPTIVTDVWVYYPAMTLPLAMCPFSPPQESDGVKGFNHLDDPKLTAQPLTIHLFGTYSDVPMTSCTHYPVKGGPTANDKDVWNARLMLTGPNRQFVTRNGLPAADGALPTGMLPVGRDIALFDGEIASVEYLDASTTCVPFMASDATRIYLATDVPNATLITKACNKSATLARGILLLGDITRAPDFPALAEFNDYMLDAANSYFLSKTDVAIAPQVDIAAITAGAPNAESLLPLSALCTATTQPAPIQGADTLIV